MNVKLKLTILTGCLCFVTAVLKAQEGIVVKKNGYSLRFKSNAPTFTADLQQRLTKTFFAVYPALVKEFNPKSSKHVTFFIDTAYKGVAATSNDVVVFNPVYMQNHPKDIDVVTHEVMHIVQGYGYSAGPVWMTEGIADYVRNKYGVDNAGADWTMPEANASQSYTNSYRITGRFFTWMDNRVKNGMIKTIDKSLRDHVYTPAIWKELTGKNIDELWAEYLKNPDLS